MIITHEQWRGMPAVRLADERYEAVILAQYGANCVSLIHRPSGLSLLRTPPDAEAMRLSPNVYGLPVLFPPNRIRDGVFRFEGRSYAFPINEPERHHHIHGFLSRTAFAETEPGTFVYRATSEQPYLQFPHAFCVMRTYRLTPDGLLSTITVRNDSACNMPLGLGVHAAWNVPAPDWRLRIGIKREWTVDKRILPTGAVTEASPLLDALRQGTFCPEGHALSNLLELGDSTVWLENGEWRIVCTVGKAFPFLMLWNGGGHSGFVCPEPQSWLVDAPNLTLPAAQSGFRCLSPGESMEYSLRYAVQCLGSR